MTSSTPTRPVLALAALAGLAVAACAERAPPASGTALEWRGKAGTPGASTLDAIVPPPWDALRSAVGEATGLPLAVSNNPEHVFTRGVLFDTRPGPGVEVRGPDAPVPAAIPGAAPDASAEQGCAPGRYRALGLYLAHILDRDIPGLRRLSVVADVDEPATIRWRGAIGASGWSRDGRPATRRTDWLGAAVSSSFFFGSAPEGTVTVTPGVPISLAVAEAEPNGLVEGRFEIHVDGGCARLRVVAHGEAGASPELGGWAWGDVKWPGWLDGRGFGRAAGVYEADGWVGAEAVGLLEVGRTEGRALLTVEQAMRASVHLADSAELLFGNYGALYVERLVLWNRTGGCVVAGVDLVAYADRGAASVPRAPTAAYHAETAGQGAPTMVWNGLVGVRVDGGGRRFHHPVLHPTPDARDLAAPHTVMGSLRARLATVRIEAEGQAEVEVELPVPGYVLAPIALLVTPVDCRDVE